MLTVSARSAPASAPACAFSAPVGEPSGPPAVRSGWSFVQWVSKPTAATVPQIRTRVGAVLGGWCIAAAVADNLLLVASELVSNAVRHAGAVTERLRVSMAFGGGWLQLEVCDSDPVLPSAGPAVVDLESESGRGLMIVHLLVAEMRGEVDAIPRGCGKAVRVRIPAA